MDLQIKSKVPDAGKSRTWKRAKDTNIVGGSIQVRDEIVQMLKGMLCASICPAISVELAKHGYSQVDVIPYVVEDI